MREASSSHVPWSALSVDDVLGPDGLASMVHRAWESRPEQLAMARAVHDGLTDGQPLVIEAPTGVGKTLAYLVPALLFGGRVIVSTHTKTLQEQIATKDLPLLERALAAAGLTLRASEPHEDADPGPQVRRWTVMKGRANYLCLDRLDRSRIQVGFSFDGEGHPVDRIAEWAEVTDHGDRSELTWLAEDDGTWGRLDARSDICVGRRCSRWDDCFVVRMRARAQNAELIIVNHHLLFADLALRAQASMSTAGAAFGEIIPRGHALIVDEAHAIEEIASGYFGGEVSSHKLARLAKDVDGFVTGGAISTAGLDPLEVVAQRAASSVEDTFAALPRGDGRQRVDASEEFDSARAAAEQAVGDLELLAERLTHAGEGDPITESLARRATELGRSLELVLQARDDEYVYWCERRGRTVRLGASPIEVGHLLSEHLFGAFRSVAMTSATLCTQDGDSGFEYFLSRVGAPPEARTECLGSPFDFASQAALLVHSEVPEPDDPEFVDAICDAGVELIELIGGGVFFLFTSHRALKAARRRLRGRVRYPLLAQGDAPKRALLEDFVRRAPAVLLATSSFWEGVDVPGDPLKMVMIDRLPFASPGDPLVAARAARIQERGGSPFASYQVPQAILRLKQGFGRLVRGRGDTGVVVLFDRRVETRSYGRRFLRALPPASRVSDVPHLRLWLEENLC